MHVNAYHDMIVFMHACMLVWLSAFSHLRCMLINNHDTCEYMYMYVCKGMYMYVCNGLGLVSAYAYSCTRGHVCIQTI
jgi:hypothetical protein